MNGVIALVNIDENSAILVDENKQQYPFHFDDWIGSDVTPEVGLKVEFDINNGEVFFVKALETKTYLETIDKKNSNIDLGENIEIDIDVLDCLNNYFDEVISVVYDYEAKFGEGETLDFLLMKRFLNTAYNNLQDMDSTFMGEYLLELRDDLKTLESVYQKFYKKYTPPEVAYETIFLDQQATYKNYKKRIDANLSEFHRLKTTIKSLEFKIKNLEEEIHDLSIVNKLQSKNIDLKRYNRLYVDAIHRAGNIKEENTRLKESLEKFEQKYKEKFTSIYIKEAKKYDKFIREQLDGYAYEFDKKMWEAAETSSSIRSFFKRANIDDDFSSKTFLKYFIRGLDESKFSKEHKRLYSLLEYLEGRAKVRILIVNENQKESDSIKHIIRSFDKDYNVEVTDKPRSSYYRKDFAKLDMIFVDLSITNPTIYEFIDMIKKRIVQANSHAILCVTSNAFNKENLAILKEKNVDYFLATNLKGEELQKNIKEMIDSLDV